MWTRKDLKEKAKTAFKRNYWKAILVSMAFILLCIGILSSITFGSTSNNNDKEKVWEIREKNVVDVVADIAGSLTEENIAEIRKDFEQMNKTEKMTYYIAFLVTIITIVIAIVIFASILSIFIANPLRVGASRFMLKSADDKGNVAELGFAFDHSYKNIVKTKFFCNLYIFLWALLFIVPGIYKYYQYYMVNYILAENPSMQRKEVLECSKNIMKGQKWKTFVLDLSFIFYHILGIISFGLVEIFYVKPYVCLTHALLYDTLVNTNIEQVKLREVII